jgi:hypothetical protein
MLCDRILYVCFDPALLLSRERVLLTRDYEVSTVLGADGLLALPNVEDFDFILIGDEGPLAQRRKAVRYVRQQEPHAPVIALCHGREELPEADHEISTADPKAWLDAVDHCIRERENSA